MSVVATCRGEVTDVFHTGQSDIKRGLQIGNDTKYKIASISKHVTTIGLMRLYEEGKF
jgi:CubicO group peptidase (beta-lactamase class C family)